MRLASGARIGPYQVVSPLGEGGMGEVYRCTDTRLNRTVAVKVLSTTLMADEEFRGRFNREANVLSRLDHPNICTVHDVGETEGMAFVVMPLLEGQTLSDWITRSRPRGAELVSQVLDIAVQMADALAHAHDRGVVHRDLKPANVMLTPHGVKLLDFGIARVVTPASGETDATRADVTRPGQALGTPAYMAPEQLEGSAGTHSDVWAFGAVLFEMLTGRRFADDPPSRVLATGDLDIPIEGTEPTATLLRHFLSRCLARSPADRLATGRALALELKWIGAPKPLPPSSPKSGARTWGAVAVAVAASALAALVVTRRAPVIDSPSPRQFSLLVSNTAPFSVGGLPNAMALAPDGSGVAHLAWTEGRAGLLHYRDLAKAFSSPLPGTEGAVAPFFSPDSRWIGFLVGRTVKKVAVSGGGVVELATVGDRPGQPAWLQGDRIVVPDATGLADIPAGGGAPRVIVPLDATKGEIAFNSPTYLADRNTLVFAIRRTGSSWNDATIVAHQVESQRRSVLVEGGFAPRVIAGRYLVFARGTDLLGAAINQDAIAVDAPPVPLLAGVANPITFGWSQSAMNDAGTLIYAATATRTPGRLVWVDRHGLVLPAHAATQVFDHPRLAPDGKRFVVETRGPNIDVWLGTIGGVDLERLSFSPGEDESPVWHPDGRRVAYAASRNNRRITLLKEVGGSGEEQEIGDHGTWHHHLGVWSPDGMSLTLAASETSGLPWSPFVLKLGQPTRPLLQQQATYSLQASTFAPNGKWIAYSSDESGRSEIYVSPADDLGTKRQLTSEGGAAPLWARSGAEIFFQRGDRMFVAAVSMEPQFTVYRTEPLFDGVFEEIYWGERNYDVTADGRRFLMVRPDSGRPTAELRVVLNWLTELQTKIGR